MRKGLIIFGSIVVVIFAALLILPAVFKDDIKRAIDKAIAESVNADVIWEADDFSLSLISNFPNVSAGLKNIGVVNRAPFEGEILFIADEIEVEIDLFSLFGDQIRVIGIELTEPVINIQVDEEGRANYDIAISDEETEELPADSSNFNLGIEHWRITNGKLTYSDKTFPFVFSIANIEHSGSGDFTALEFDMSTSTSADSMFVSYGDVVYLRDKSVRLDAVLAISEEYSRYVFKDNTIRINDFTIGVDGFLKMLDDGFDMDLKASAKDNSFKSLLSLVPGMYTSDFDKIRANGTLDFLATAKGLYNDDRLPAFSLQLITENSMFQYPEVPRAVENISVNMLVNNTDGKIENTSVDISKFHADFGKNPVDATLKLANLSNYQMDGRLNASLDFADITSIFPVEGMQVRGNGKADLTFSGIYDSVRNVMPSISGTVVIDNAYIKSDELPYALEKLNLNSEIANPSGKMSDFRAAINLFSMQLDGAPFRADGKISNLDNYTWDINAQGSVDLAKLASIFKFEDMVLEGQLMADIHTQGNMAALDAERYAELPTSGDVTVRNFLYSSEDLPQAFAISEAALTFDPSRMNLVRFKSTMGASDFDLTGYVSNYIGYAFGEGKVLKGQLNLNSGRIDLNEFMSSEDSDDPSIDSAMSVIPVPRDIDFTVNATAALVNLMNMNMTNASGSLIIQDETMKIDGFRFDMLGGSFVADGSYSTRDILNPSYSFSLNVDEVKIAEAFSTFEIVEKFVPVASQLQGMVSSQVSINGNLLQDMSPDLKTVNVDGVVEVIRATLKNSEIMNGISSLTNLNTGDELTIQDLLMSVTIRNGQLQVKPFKVKLGEYTTEIAGATSLDGSIAYNVTMDVPAGKLGTQLNSFLAQYSQAPGKDDIIPVTVGLGGTYLEPKAVLLMDDQKQIVEDALKQKLSEEAAGQAEDLLENVKDEKTKEILGNILGKQPADSVKKDSVATPAVEEKLKEEAVDKIKDIFKKKKKDDSEKPSGSSL